MISFLSVVPVGFFLGMRHATDPDHVIAVTTIVSRQRNFLKAAMTGIFWGVGHTLTIFVVCTIIILFDVVRGESQKEPMDRDGGTMTESTKSKVCGKNAIRAA
jgi:high-affinity nickel permease